MPINVQCPCGKQFRVRDELAGRRGKCSECGASVNIPDCDKEEEEDPFAAFVDNRTPMEKLEDAELANQERRERAVKETVREAAQETGRAVAYNIGAGLSSLLGGIVLGVLARVLIRDYVYLAFPLGMLLGGSFFHAWWTEPPRARTTRTGRGLSNSGKGCPKCGFTHKWNGTVCGHCGHIASSKYRLGTGEADREGSP